VHAGQGGEIIVDVHAGDDLSVLAGAWEIDATHSTVEFIARYAVFTRVRGRFTSFGGTVVLDPPYFEATQIDIHIDAASVDTSLAVRDAHLLGADFFDVDQHPTISFRGRGATLLAPGRYTVSGALDVRGIAQPLRLSVDAFGCAADMNGRPRLGLRATAKLRRSIWGITWNAPVRGGGVALADDVDLELDVSLVPADVDA
jgi:polyisoprenoid-binding protein YceI